ncbi:hypothetical protein GLOIN_2v1885624 [Rhizophagus clarus]|nr:hypothetical protein GLOIN_2v1885624 [Rhizophagus clarus]
MTTISCTRCSLILDQSFFIKEKGGFYTRCINCRNQNNKYIRKRKEIEESQKSISILSYEELDQRLSEMIDDIGEEEYFENCETGIKFSCFIDISFLKNKTPKEIVDDIKNFIGKIDGYYYM